MSINFAAVHDQRRWRKHRIHQSLQSAIDGKDGAKSLLRKVGRVSGMWRKYGEVHCVFVWFDGATSGHAFRLSPDGSGAVQTIEVGIDQIARFDKNKDCNEAEISLCFDAYPLLERPREALGIESNSSDNLEVKVILYPDDLHADQQYVEGMAKQVLVNGYERSPEARRICISHYDCICQVCNVDFSKRYGQLGEGFIHVHHRTPLSGIGKKYCIDPIKDLVPVCPNCHAMLHRREPPLELEELRSLLKTA